MPAKKKWKVVTLPGVRTLSCNPRRDNLPVSVLTHLSAEVPEHLYHMLEVVFASFVPVRRCPLQARLRRKKSGHVVAT